MLELFKTKAYKKSIKKYSKLSKFKIEEVESVIKTIQKREHLDQKFRDHELKGVFQGIRECHIKSDLLLLYQIDESEPILILVNLGTHSELFE